MGLARVVAATATVAVAVGLGGCASCARDAKTFQSDFDGGLSRKVTLYSNTGDVIKTWRGKIDLAADTNEVWFDLDGKRVNINGGIVVVEEGE